jgi:hypothetical protein
VNEEVNRNVVVLEMWRGKWILKCYKIITFVWCFKKSQYDPIGESYVLNLEIY